MPVTPLINGVKFDIVDTIKDKSGRHLHKIGGPGLRTCRWGISHLAGGLLPPPRDQPPPLRRPPDPLGPAAKDHKGWFHINCSGKQLYEARFFSIEPFYNGFSVAETFENKKIIIDEQGKEVLVI
jgi:hypothetical protein